MRASLDHSDDRPLYVQIMDEVRRALVRGALRPEDALPSVRELAAALAVNPRTVLQAYQELEGEGVLYVRRGQGTFVAPGIRRDGRERLVVARDVARRALLDAGRSGLGVDELVSVIREVAAAEDGPSAGSRSTANAGDDR